MIKLDYGIHAFGELLWFMRWLENVLTYIKTWLRIKYFGAMKRTWLVLRKLISFMSYHGWWFEVADEVWNYLECDLMMKWLNHESAKFLHIMSMNTIRKMPSFYLLWAWIWFFKKVWEKWFFEYSHENMILAWSKCMKMFFWEDMIRYIPWCMVPHRGDAMNKGYVIMTKVL